MAKKKKRLHLLLLLLPLLRHLLLLHLLPKRLLPLLMHRRHLPLLKQRSNSIYCLKKTTSRWFFFAYAIPHWDGAICQTPSLQRYFRSSANTLMIFFAESESSAPPKESSTVILLVLPALRTAIWYLLAWLTFSELLKSLLKKPGSVFSVAVGT